MIWYPYQQMKTMDKPIKIIGAEGVYLYTENKKLIDSISSWWCVIHGYNHSEINEVLKNQVDRFSHVMLGGLTHDPAEKLSKKLEEFLPGDLNYCFFSDSGSIGVEVALKMARQYFINREEKRELTLSLRHSYHGDTFKAMEVGDDEDYHFVFSDKKNAVHIEADIRSLEDVFKDKGKDFYCMILEPLLQGAGGMRMYDVSFLERARELCDEYGVILIFDEVATGFGRTGHRFVSDLVLPDILVLGKGLTGGYMGHAVTVANERVFKAFYSDDPEHAFMHGPTFMANPLACEVCLKSIEIFERDNYMEKVENIERIMKREMEGFAHRSIKEIRIMGACLCIEVYNSETLKGFRKFAHERGVFNRPFLNYMYIMPPYIIEEDELIYILDVMKSWFLSEN